MAEKMQKATRYTVFKTKWGYFGLAGTELGLLRTCLPGPEFGKIKSQLLENLCAARYDKALFKVLREQITAYFDGAYVNFDKDIPIILDGFSLFTRRVLGICRDIRFGQTISYAGLAGEIGRAGAARAVGGALAKNPLPLIVPCHRVVRSDGKIGGFSAAGGITLKKRLLELEQKILLSVSL
jgi:methylated-DNA-[protein]-cysteine S-methyltransferase